MNNRKIQRRAKRARNTFLRGNVNLIVKYVFKGTIITEAVKVRNILIWAFYNLCAHDTWKRFYIAEGIGLFFFFAQWITNNADKH